MNLIDKIKHDTEYMTTMIAQLNTDVDLAYAYIQNGEDDKAKIQLDTADAYYKNCQHSLTTCRVSLFASDDSDSDSDSEVNLTDVDFQTCGLAFHNKQSELAAIYKKLTACIQENRSGAELKKREKEAKEAAAKVDAAVAKARAENTVAKKKFDKIMGIEKNEVEESITNMQILGGFIAALGVAAVAIAFVALNAGGFAMPGVVLAGFGCGSTYVGYSIFSGYDEEVNQDKGSYELHGSNIKPSPIVMTVISS